MDPEACLKRAIFAMFTNDKEDWRDALHDYAEWRQAQGFMPTVHSTAAYIEVGGDDLWFSLCFLWEEKYSSPIDMPNF